MRTFAASADEEKKASTPNASVMRIRGGYRTTPRSGCAASSSVKRAISRVASNMLISGTMRWLPSLLALGLVFAASGARADDGDSYVVRDTHMRSPALLGTGIGLATLGAVAAPIGAIIFIIPKEQPMCMGCSIDYGSSYAMGALFLGGGLAAIAASIPMMIYGAHRVPVTISPSGPMGSTGLTLTMKF